jgi:hypothetical protein
MAAATFIWVQDENGQDVRLRLPLRAQIAADNSTPVPVQQARLTAANDTVSAVIQADDNSPVPVQQAALTASKDSVSVVAPAGTLTDHSGTLTAGATAQQAVAAEADRKFLFVQNVDPAEVLWVNVGVVAVQGQPSIQLIAGAICPPIGSNYVPTGLVSVIATTIGHPFVCKVGV